MTTCSKELFYKTFEYVDCRTFVHPSDYSCVESFLKLFIEGIKGTGKFYFLIYLVQLLIKPKSITKQTLQQSLKCFILSSLFGGVNCCFSLGSICFLRNLLGKFNYYCLCIVPGTIGGLSVFIDHPSRRGFDIVTYLYLALDIIFRTLEAKGYIRKTLIFQTALFSVINAILLYMLRIVKQQTTYLWLFTPSKCKLTQKGEGTKCSHNGSCRREIVLSGIKYFSFGVAIQWIRSLLPLLQNFRRSSLKLLKLQSHHIRMGLFTGLYVTTYKVISCSLCQLLGYDSPSFAIPAGLAAGLTYLLKPDFSITLIALSNLVLVLERHLKKNGVIPSWPFGEIIFALCGGFLPHSRTYTPSCTPKDVPKLMSAFTNERTDQMYKTFLSIISKSQ